MKLSHLLVIVALFFGYAIGINAGIVDHGEYYIISEYYDKVLGLSADGTNVRLSSIGTNSDADSYVFVAESSDSEGYWYLRNKSTGKYLTASTSNSYSVVWSSSKGTGNQYLWKLDVQFGKSIVSKKNTSNRLGCDWSTDDYVSVYYDKPASSRARFHVVPAIEGGYQASLSAAETDVYTSSIGVQEKDYYQISKTTVIEDKMDVHLISGDRPLSANINMKNGSWLIFENVRPSDVISKYLKYVKKNGATATNGTNVRVAMYLDGTVVMPFSTTTNAFKGYTGENFTGKVVNLKCRNNSTLGKDNNTIRSFTLQRGYMAVVASGQNGSGYSRVYVADHADLEVPILPDGLNQRVSSVHIKKWEYVSKKGWCSTQETSGILGGMKTMNATWFYTWSADRSSSDNAEYVPIKQHIYWPSWTQISDLSESTHVLSYNEPEHSEQHNKCDCGGTIDAWTATTKVPDFYQTGMRIGSPAPTDLSWLTTFSGHVDDMAYRCDFVALHAYWGPNEANGVSEWYDKLKSVYDNTHRPIWITEWAYGASWTTESWPSGYSDQLEKNRAAIMDIVDMLERTPFIERYSYYQWDTNSRRFINDDGWVTPAGEVYQKTKSTFAYNSKYQRVPNYWKPGNRTPELSYELSEDGKTITFTMTNPYGDVSDQFILQRRRGNGEWETLYSEGERYKLENDKLTYSMAISDIDEFNDVFRIYNTTIFGGTSISSELSMYSFIINPDCNDGTKAWTVSNLGTNTGEASDGDGSNTYWNQWKANGLNSSMSQTIDNLPAGTYTLSALLRGSTNCLITLDAKVTRAVAEGDDTNQATAEIYGTGNTTEEGSDYQYGWKQVELMPLELREGDKLTITASGYSASGSTWWSADHFVLKYEPPVGTGIKTIEAERIIGNGKIYTLDGRVVSPDNARHGIFIVNGKAVILN